MYRLQAALTTYKVLKPSSAGYAALVNSHVLQFSKEKEPLWDTAPATDSAPIAFPRQIREAFIPIGHVSLDFMPATGNDPAQRRIGATSLFISPALRGQDFARQAIETIRSVVRHYARFVVAEAPVRETDEAVERFENFGDGRPKVCCSSDEIYGVELMRGRSIPLWIGMRVLAGNA